MDVIFGASGGEPVTAHTAKMRNQCCARQHKRCWFVVEGVVAYWKKWQQPSKTKTGMREACCHECGALSCGNVSLELRKV